jgi:hypothetical protein
VREYLCVDITLSIDIDINIDIEVMKSQPLLQGQLFLVLETIESTMRGAFAPAYLPGSYAYNVASMLVDFIRIKRYIHVVIIPSKQT